MVDGSTVVVDGHTHILVYIREETLRETRTVNPKEGGVSQVGVWVEADKGCNLREPYTGEADVERSGWFASGVSKHCP